MSPSREAVERRYSGAKCVPTTPSEPWELVVANLDDDSIPLRVVGPIRCGTTRTAPLAVLIVSALSAGCAPKQVVFDLEDAPTREVAEESDPQKFDNPVYLGFEWLGPPSVVAVFTLTDLTSGEVDRCLTGGGCSDRIWTLEQSSRFRAELATHCGLFAWEGIARGDETLRWDNPCRPTTLAVPQEFLGARAMVQWGTEARGDGSGPIRLDFSSVSTDWSPPVGIEVTLWVETEHDCLRGFWQAQAGGPGQTVIDLDRLYSHEGWRGRVGMEEEVEVDGVKYRTSSLIQEGLESARPPYWLRTSFDGKCGDREVAGL